MGRVRGRARELAAGTPASPRRRQGGTCDRGGQGRLVLQVPRRGLAPRQGDGPGGICGRTSRGPHHGHRCPSPAGCGSGCGSRLGAGSRRSRGALGIPGPARVRGAGRRSAQTRGSGGRRLARSRSRQRTTTISHRPSRTPEAIWRACSRTSRTSCRTSMTCRSGTSWRSWMRSVSNDRRRRSGRSAPPSGRSTRIRRWHGRCGVSRRCLPNLSTPCVTRPSKRPSRPVLRSRVSMAIGSETSWPGGQGLLPALYRADAEVIVDRLRSSFLDHTSHASQSVTGMTPTERERKKSWTVGRRDLENEFRKGHALPLDP